MTMFGMKRTGKELSYAVAGFIGGLITCYILFGAAIVRQHHANSTTQAPAQLFASTTRVVPFHIVLPAQQPIASDALTERVNPFKKSPELRNVPKGTLPETYSVELLDGRR